MANSKIINLNNIFIFLFLAVFPFGQLIRIGMVHPVDIIAGLGAIYSLVVKMPKPSVFKYLEGFLIIAASSWLFSLFIFNDPRTLYGVLYLIRLSVYVYFFIYVWNFARVSVNKKLLTDSLLTVSLVGAVFGWMQFILMPDLKPLFLLGWDMHLYRLAGTFLDPAYLGLIIVFGLIISVHRAIDLKQKKYWYLTAFLLISLAFTYSRASYLAFMGGMTVIALHKRKFKALWVLICSLIVLVLLLPTAKNKSIELLRTFSAVSRIQNYSDSIDIFKKSPVLGVGYNNMCLAFNRYIGYQKYSSHACSGSDSSLLFILTTTGIAGMLIFMYGIMGVSKETPYTFFKSVLTSSFVALIIHSFFSNSLFYPWIMWWLIILLSVAT